MHDLSGARIDRYTIEEELGRGGMARVYRARDSRLGRDVALKVLAPEMMANDESVARFLREARAAARLDHPNIVHVHDTGQSDGYHFIAMRYVEGDTLRQRLAQSPLSPRDAAEVLTQVASALDYAHAHGVLHRDIKPENILLDVDGPVMLTDFGVASAADELSVTTTGRVVGTPVYMAPELLRGEPATARSEVYALGILAYELLSGSPPFAGRPAYAVMLAHLDERPQPVDQVVEGIPPAVAAVIGRALEKSPAARFESAGELARRLDDALTARPVVVTRSSTAARTAGSSAPTAVGSRMSVPRGQAWRRPGRLGLTSIGLLLGALLLFVGALSGNGAPDGDEAESEVLAVGATATARPSPTVTAPVTPTAQEQATGWEIAVPVVHGERNDEATGSNEESAPDAEPVVESVVEPEAPAIESVADEQTADDPVEAPAGNTTGQSEEQGQDAPPAPPAAQPEGQDGDSQKPEKDEKEKKDKKEKPGLSGGGSGEPGNSPGNSGDVPGNSGNGPGNSDNAPGNSGGGPGNSGNGSNNKKN